MSSFGYIF